LGHCGLEQGSLRERRRRYQDFSTWKLPFDEKSVLVSEDTFRFLSLPVGELPFLLSSLYTLICFLSISYGVNERLFSWLHAPMGLCGSLD
jgi:hypothetical protein